MNILEIVVRVYQEWMAHLLDQQLRCSKIVHVIIIENNFNELACLVRMHWGNIGLWTSPSTRAINVPEMSLHQYRPTLVQ